MKKLFLIFPLLFLSVFAHAVDLEYKGFYKRLDLIADNELNLITMGFYLVDSHSRQRCKLTKATMYAKDERAQNIEIAEDGQILVALSEELYKKQAFLRVVQQDEFQNCTLQMQIQAKDKAKRTFNFKELAEITSQMQELVDDFGSFLWFMMPNVQGLHINIESKEQIVYIAPVLAKKLNCQEKECKLAIDLQSLNSDKAIEFRKAPIVIAPWISED